MLFNGLGADLRYGVSQLRKSPAFTVAAAIALALGIGANTTIFSWLNAVMLNPLPGVDEHGLMSLRWRAPNGSQASLSWPDYLDMSKRVRTATALAAVSEAPMSFGEGSRPERIWAMLVSANYFDSLGVRPALGRAFQPDEDENPGGHPVTVISHHLWQTRFGGDRGIVGRQIRLNNRPFTVVGVAPEGFLGSIVGLGFELYVPISMREAVSGSSDPLRQRGNHWLAAHVRLKPGIGPRQTETELTAISAQLAREFDKSDRYARAELVPIWREGGGQMRAPVVSVLMAVVGVVLLIACANVANLLLARGAARRHEIAIRQALGVSRGRLVRQLLVENGLLALLGCGGALLAARFSTSLLMGFAPVSDLPVALQIRTDRTVLLFTLAVSAFATVLFGLLPALRVSRIDVAAALKDNGGGSAGARKTSLRNSLVVTQVTLSMVLLAGAGLLLKSLTNAAAANPGFDPRQVLLAGVDFFPNGYDAPRAKAALRQMLENIDAIPGIAGASTVRRVPLGLGGSNAYSIQVEGYSPTRDEELVVFVHTIGPDYFHTMRTPLAAGREFAFSDSDEAQRVIVVNDSFARRYLAQGDPLGRRVKVAGESRIVVGVARDSKFQSLDEKRAPALYFPVLQVFASESNFLVRTTGDPTRAARAVEAAIHAVDPTLPVYGQRTLQASIATAYFGQRLGGSFLAAFGGLALLLAAVGLYGVLALSVEQRSREVGVRIALGANRADILRLILGQGLRLAAFGLAIGLAISLAVTRLMSSLLFAVSPTDPATLLGVSLLLAAVAAAASLIPAWRAAGIDPVLAIRHH